MVVTGVVNLRAGLSGPARLSPPATSGHNGPAQPSPPETSGRNGPAQSTWNLWP